MYNKTTTISRSKVRCNSKTFWFRPAVKTWRIWVYDATIRVESSAVLKHQEYVQPSEQSSVVILLILKPSFVYCQPSAYRGYSRNNMLFTVKKIMFVISVILETRNLAGQTGRPYLYCKLSGQISTRLRHIPSIMLFFFACFQPFRPGYLCTLLLHT